MTPAKWVKVRTRSGSAVVVWTWRVSLFAHYAVRWYPVAKQWRALRVDSSVPGKIHPVTTTLFVCGAEVDAEQMKQLVEATAALQEGL